MSTTYTPSITAPGYWFITGVDKAGNNVAGIVKYSKVGSLPHATHAVFIDGPNVKSISMDKLHAAIVETGATFLYEIPATGHHNNLQSIGARAVGEGKALYTNLQAGVQPTNDLTIAALIAGGATAAGVVGAGVAAAGAEATGIAGGALGGVAGILAVFASIAFWTRLGEAILGGVLMVMALRSLTGTAHA